MGAAVCPSTPPHAAPDPIAGSVPRRVGFVSVHTSPLERPGSGDSGGMNVYLDRVASQLVGRGIEVDVFTRAAGPDVPRSVLAPDGYRVHHIEAGPPHLTKADLASHLCAFYLGLAAHPRVAGLDLLHAHYWMSGWVGRQARQRLGLPLVQSFHTLAHAKNASLAPGDMPEPALRVHAEERIVADADAVIAPTPAEADLLRERMRARPGAVHVVEPGADLEVFTPDGDRDAARAVLGGGRIVLFVGRLQPLKGPDVAVRTLAALARRLPDGPPVRLVVVGGPSGNGVGTTDHGRLRALARELGVEDRLALLAPRPQAELADLYRAADAVLVPSRSESFGLAALEAQACGTPVVAADVPGLRHVLGSGGGGRLVRGWDAQAYAEALVPYLSDPRERAGAGAAGVAHARLRSWERTAAATLAVYEGVLAVGDVAADAPAGARGA
jgi:D-inositol-3-phosphate glycosyltransferase